MSVSSKTPDPGSTQHTERVQNSVKGMDEFEKVAAEMVQHLSGSDQEKEDSKTKQKDGSQTDQIAKANAFMLLNSQQAQLVENVRNLIKNISSPSQPQLIPPNSSVKGLQSIPTDHTGTGNPWLVGSLTTKLFEVWMSILPILMEIKIKEAAANARETVAAQAFGAAAADYQKQATEKEAENLRLDAQKEFIKAGVAFATMVLTVADQAAGQLKDIASSVKGALQQGVSSVGSMAMSVGSMVAGAAMSGGGTGGTGGDTNAAPAGNDAPPANEAPPSNQAPAANEAPPANQAPVANEAPAANMEQQQDMQQQGLEQQNIEQQQVQQQNQLQQQQQAEQSNTPEGNKANVNEKGNDQADQSGKGKSDAKESANEQKVSFDRQTNALRNADMFQRMSQGMAPTGGGPGIPGAPPGMSGKTMTQLMNVAEQIANGCIDLKKAGNVMQKAQFEYLSKTLHSMYELSQKRGEDAKKAQQGVADQIAAIFQAMQQFLQSMQQAFNFRKG